MKDIFNKTVSEEVINRINSLSPKSEGLWGKMTVDQMLAHCNVAYHAIYSANYTKPKGLKKWMLKTFVKKIVVSEKPYKRNGRTAPEFLIVNKRDFEKEKEQLNSYIKKTQELGGHHFDNKESHSFGVLTKTEWNNMFYKHLDHHLNQFGV
ncbi:DUF1569 domain-containing protein [Bizionia arctica]|uniref:DUF1569 domain-containing protein n=1 Tax=Bizionia arctica TaxID=1495645 RepID=A0A917LNB0_9FLAO|nr:DUF1569 domain-containing protein [Bizionia arctica]GGG46067.1 hypothetical protein GCM10010976_17040 [Bizionia arctica]